MSIQLKLNHEEGLRLRQQTAHKVERVEGIADKSGTTPGAVKSGTDWKFDKYQEDNGKTTDEVPQDRDPRRVGNDGKKIPLGTYTLHITAGMRNLVVERKGKVSPFNFKNEAVRNQMRIRYQVLSVKKGKDGSPVQKDGKPVHVWEDSGQPQYIPPNTFGGVYVGDNQRAILDEMPT
jgi:hypothetical protein